MNNKNIIDKELREIILEEGKKYYPEDPEAFVEHLLKRYNLQGSKKVSLLANSKYSSDKSSEKFMQFSDQGDVLQFLYRNNDNEGLTEAEYTIFPNYFPNGDGMISVASYNKNGKSHNDTIRSTDADIKSLINRNMEHMKNKFQQGGTAQNQQQQMIAAFAQWGAKKYGKGQMSPEQFLQQVQQMPLEQQQQLLQEFQQDVQKGGVMARLGAKLEYYKKLKGECPEGYEMKFFKVGGKVCKQCEKAEKASCGKKLKEGNAVDKFKKERSEKAYKGACGSKMKKKKC